MNVFTCHIVGRDPLNPSNRNPMGSGTAMQRVELHTNYGVCGSLTHVSKDNVLLLLEPIWGGVIIFLVPCVVGAHLTFKLLNFLMNLARVMPLLACRKIACC